MQQRTPGEVVRLVQGRRCRDRRPPVHRPAWTDAALLGPGPRPHRGRVRGGLGFDGSSIRGFQEIQESDMLLFPDPNTAVIDPFRQHKTLNLNCFVRDPITLESLLT